MSSILPPPPPPPRPDVPPARDERKLAPPPWRALEAIPVYVIAIILGFFAVAGISLSKPGCDLRHPTAACASAFVLSTLFGELAFLVAVVFWVRVVDRAPLRALGLPRTPLRDLGAGIAGGAGLVVVGYIGGIIVFTVAGLILGHQPTQPNQVPTYVQHGTLVWSGVVVVLAAPLGEETLFRGFLYRGLRRRFSVWPAALISAALFALVHVSPVLVFALFPVGIGLALIFEWRQSLLASMAAHATFNLVGIIFIALSRR